MYHRLSLREIKKKKNVINYPPAPKEQEQMKSQGEISHGLIPGWNSGEKRR